jgi:hypothetical protein
MMSLCPEGEFRASLGEQEFWEYVFHVLLDFYPDDESPDLDDETSWQYTPCPACEVLGPCGYDAQGLPMVHVYTVPEDE